MTARTSCRWWRGGHDWHWKLVNVLVSDDGGYAWEQTQNEGICQRCGLTKWKGLGNA